MKAGGACVSLCNDAIHIWKEGRTHALEDEGREGRKEGKERQEGKRKGKGRESKYRFTIKERETKRKI